MSLLNELSSWEHLIDALITLTSLMLKYIHSFFLLFRVYIKELLKKSILKKITFSSRKR